MHLVVAVGSDGRSSFGVVGLDTHLNLIRRVDFVRVLILVKRLDLIGRLNGYHRRLVSSVYSGWI